MTEAYIQALTELDEVLNFIEDDLLAKVPTNFRNFVKQKKDKEYKFVYNEELPLEEQELKSETKALLSIMYRDYWCSPEEREKIIQADKEELRKIEEEKREKYNPDNLFKTKVEQNTEQTVAMAVIKEKENFITRIFNAIKRIFTKK